MNFLRKLELASRARDSVLCVCLDPDPSRIPETLGRGPQAVLRFNRRIVKATAEYAAAFKLNLAFYEQLGAAAMDVLTLTLQTIPADIPVIADAKRGDVPNTAERYAHAFFDVLRFDAMTFNPYVGLDSIVTFVSGERFGFGLVRTSNPGAGDFQDLRVDGVPLYEVVARRLDETAPPERLGFVVGATYPEQARRLRGLAPERLFLLPGVGAQGGSIARAVEAAVNDAGDGVLPAVARDILYASTGLDFADAAARRARELRDAANEARRRVPASG